MLPYVSLLTIIRISPIVRRAPPAGPTNLFEVTTAANAAGSLSNYGQQHLSGMQEETQTQRSPVLLDDVHQSCGQDGTCVDQGA